MAVKIQLRGDTKASWLVVNPILSEREIVLETDTGKYKIGNGVAHYADLSYHGIDGKPSRITADGFWEIYSPATDTYVKTEHKGLGSDGKSAFELWQALEGNAGKTIADFFVYLKGQKGDAFTFNDFTIEQLALLKGASAYQVWKIQPGNESKTVDEYLLYIKGAPFTYADFTPEQIITLTGKSAYQIWQKQPGNEGKTIEQYLIAIKGQDGQSAYLDAKAKGYVGTKDEFDALLAKLGVRATIAADGLMSKEDKVKVDSVATNANNYSHPSYTPRADGLYKVTVDEKGHILSAADVTKADITSLGIPEQDTTYAPATTSVDGLMSAADKTRLNSAIVPNDVYTVTSLSSLSNTKYSQEYTYTTSTAQPINFASVPAEGFECMLDIKNSTSSNITQAIPNAAAWQCEETSLVIPAGKVGCISIRYVHGKYCVRVGL